MLADLAQPRKCSIVTRPIFLMTGWGLGMRRPCERSIDSRFGQLMYVTDW